MFVVPIFYVEFRKFVWLIAFFKINYQTQNSNDRLHIDTPRWYENPQFLYMPPHEYLHNVHQPTDTVFVDPWEDYYERNGNIDIQTNGCNTDPSNSHNSNGFGHQCDETFAEQSTEHFQLTHPIDQFQYPSHNEHENDASNVQETEPQFVYETHRPEQSSITNHPNQSFDVVHVDSNDHLHSEEITYSHTTHTNHTTEPNNTENDQVRSYRSSFLWREMQKTTKKNWGNLIFILWKVI